MSDEPKCRQRSTPSIWRSKVCPATSHVSVHICQGNYAVGKEYDAQIGHRYFDAGRYKADLVCQIDCSSYLIEHDMTPHYEGLLGNQQLGVGAVDVQDPKIETGETVADRIRQFVAGAGADDHHQFMRLQSSAAACSLGQASVHDRGEGNPGCERWIRQQPPLSYSAELLELAHEAGQLVISIGMCKPGVSNPSPRFLSLYGLKDFDGRYDSWLSCIHREYVGSASPI